MRFYLDASVLVPTVVKQLTSAVVEAWLRASPRDLLVSDWAAAEVSSALSRFVRTGAQTLEQATRALAAFDAWRARFTADIVLIESDVRRADAYVRRFELKLLTPDALHLALASRLGATLVTSDIRLASAGPPLGLATELLSA